MGQMKKVCGWSLIGAFFFSICTVIGVIFFPYGEKVGGFESKSAVIAYIPIVIFLTILYYIILKRILEHSYKIPKGKKTKILLFYDEHLFFIAMISIFLSWLPYIIFFFPGNVSYDGYNQLDQFLGIRELTNQHPIFTTFLSGWLFQLGRNISDNMGIFFCTMFQTIVCAIVYAYVIEKIRDMGASLYECLGVNIFFAIVPVWGMFAQTVVKDTIFCAVFALTIICFFEMGDTIFKKKKQITWKNWFKWISICFLACIIRQNGKYMLFPTLLFFAILSFKYTKKFLLLLIALVMLLGGYNRVIVPATGAKPITQRALYSIPFQQTARYLCTFPEEVTEEEYDAINTVLNVEEIKKVYNPIFSDPVKNTFKNTGTKNAIKTYLKVWFEMFLKHPRVYIEAFLQHCYGYLDPFHHKSALGVYMNYIESKPAVATGDLNIYYIQDQETRSGISKYANYWTDVFPLSLSIYPGTYTWITVICILLLCKKKKWKQLAIMLIPVLQILVCIASPVNGYVRYTLPLMAITPLLIIWTLREIRGVEK